MVPTCHRYKKFKKSGKCRIRIKIRIRNSGNFFFFFNCEQFLLNACLSKMNISPKKISFLPEKVCFLHFSSSPHFSTFSTFHYIYVVKVGKILAKSLTLPKSTQYFFPGKNQIQKIREKSGYEILGIFEQILLYGHAKLMIYKFWTEIFCNFQQFRYLQNCNCSN